ncbi:MULTISPECIES: type 1 glutamine amidotransferase [unclassified Marinomonas]|uniref:type 1 glutamine amidotransferase n=1 Tax=unclassified Marinomonas TaxID=196814 RepID=UPI0007AF616E|nr:MULTISPECIES: type 1 glutamine amidotransferase [unclassified Marinomonas]
MTHLLIIEGNSPELLEKMAQADQLSDSQSYSAALQACQPDLSIDFFQPYHADSDLTTLSLSQYDGVVFTGSSVNWSVDEPEAAPLRETMKKVFANGIPTLGSCNGMQLGAVVLGGEVASSPNGRELGMAKNIKLTDAGAKHPIHQGREDDYACSCVHRDEVSKLPPGAILTAGNQHSPVQAFVYERDGIQFWGMQYHPELSPERIAELVAGEGLFNTDPELAEHLNKVAQDSESESVAALGIKSSDLAPKMRMREIDNWLKMIQPRR